MYMSADTRKIYNVLRQYGIEYNDVYEIELASACFYPNHIIGVIEKVLGHDVLKIQKAAEQGWNYLAKPIYSLLTKRDAANRPNQYEIHEDAKGTYSLVTKSLLLADFSATELQILLADIPSITQGSLNDISEGIARAKASGIRNIFYLRGILAREIDTRAGKTREATQELDQAEARAWEPPAGFVQMDASERASLSLDWMEREFEIELNTIFNHIDAKIKEH